MALRLSLFPLIAALALAGCSRTNEGALDIAFIDSAENLFADGLRLSPGAQHLRAATDSGLVALDGNGEVIPALADRWIVTDDGLSFIFRLREGEWDDGSEITAESARASLRTVLRRLRGTSLGLDLAPIEEVRAMAGRVVELRLSSPVPTLLQLLAQPELALRHGGGGDGPMRMTREADVAVLTMKTPAERGLPDSEDWADHVRPLRIDPRDAEAAVAQFDEGTVDVVLGGRIDALPLVDTGPLSRGTVRVDPAIGLFGLQVRRAKGLLETPEGREVLAMAIDRDALIAPFGVGGWSSTTRLVTPGLPGDPGLVAERWADVSLEDRRAAALARVNRWEADSEDSENAASLTLAINRSAGLDLLFQQLAGQLATVGIKLERASDAKKADLWLIDRVARYNAPRWFLNQFNCSLRDGLCDEDADFLVKQALEAPDAVSRASLLSEAEATLTLANVYIPFGPPLRWSLVRGNVYGFSPNQWGFHPLPPMAALPK